MYERYYGLKARPFQLMPDPRLLFESRNHTRALSYLIYGLERQEGFAVITGEVGTGKTLLLQTMLSQMKSRHAHIARLAMANLGAEAVLPAVTNAFGIPAKGRSKFELLDALVAKLSSGRSVSGSLLIVDEAQTCTIEALEELRIISNLQANGRALVQIFLIGQTELRDILARPSMSHLRQRIVASHQLQPLDLDEVAGYIKHRMEKVGWRHDKPVFAEGLFERVHEWTEGVPRRINLIMDRLLLWGFLEEKTQLTVAALDEVITEFEEEFAHEGIALDYAPRNAGSATVSGSGVPAELDDVALGPVMERIETIERSLRNLYGDERAQALLDQHQSNQLRHEMAAALLRLEQLENVIGELDGARIDPDVERETGSALEVDNPSSAVRADSAGHAEDNSPVRRFFQWSKRDYE